MFCYRKNFFLFYSMLVSSGVALSTTAMLSSASAQHTRSAKIAAAPRSDNVAPTTTAAPGTDFSQYKPVTYDTEASATTSDAVTSQKASGLPAVTANQTPRKPYKGPALEAGGMRFYFNAPVSPPYNASSTYTTYAGQPGGGWDATGQQGAAGEP